ncbi:MAG: YhbY family RNA-binding protein, partial [Nanoarchaeota archaeon]|nr:YhbY family RNA-binding protein [Nanoarchaeota archaeon]
MEPIIRIGKKGITDNVVSDIKNHLKNRKVIKVKMLRSFFENKDKKLVAKEIAEKTDSILVDTIGFVFV